MLCPSCRAECLADDMYCQRCGADLKSSSQSLVPAQANLPTILHHPQLPRLAAGVGALAVGFGLELVRRSLVARLMRSPRASTSYVSAPAFDSLRDAFSMQGDTTMKLPKGHGIHAT